MKKIFFIALTLMVSLGAGCISPATDTSSTDVGGKYRKVTISGDLITDYDESKSSGPVVVCQPSGEYEIVLYFPAKGGSWEGAKSYFKLTDYNCPAFNGAKDTGCTESLTSSAMVNRSFGVKGELDLSNPSTEGFDGDVYFMLNEEPELGPVDVSFSCNMGDTIKPDPMALTQIFYPFNNRENLQWSFPTAVGQVYEEEPSVAYSLGNMNYLYSVQVKQEWVDVVGH